jgi:glutamine synthetase
MHPKSRQQLTEEIDQLIKTNPDIEEFEVLVVDICGHFFGKRYPISKLGSFAREGLAFPASMFVLSSIGEALPEISQGRDDGDPDGHFELIPGSLCISDWSSKPRVQILATTSTNDEPSFFEPRQVLNNILQAFQAKKWRPMVAFELEFYLFDEQRDENGIIKVVRNPKTGNADTPTVLSASRIADFEVVIDDIIRTCRQQNIDTGAISSEMGPGQYEINFNHHDDVLRGADETCLFKRIVMEVAKKHRMCASFIAKPWLDIAGNGLHMHISVVDENGDNIFADGDKAHPRLHHAIGGLLEIMPAAMSFWAPNINSFRRFRGGLSCAPVSRTWGNENRTVAFRIPLARDGAWRVENRVPGADANPYLAMAATLAGMFYGLTNEIDPGEASTAAIDGPDASIPLNMRDALAVTLDSEGLINTMGEDFIKFYCLHRESEIVAFENYIGSREYEWYLQ